MAKGDRRIAQFRQRQFKKRIRNEILFRRKFLKASQPFGDKVSRAFLKDGIKGVERTTKVWGLAIRESMKGEYRRIYSSDSVATFDFLVNIVAKKQERISNGTVIDFDDLALEFATKNALEKSILITSTRVDRAKSLILRGIKDGLAEAKIASSLQKLYSGDISKFHAAAVARTEVGNATQHAGFQGAKSSNIDLTKQWLTAQDNAVRDLHQLLDGQIREINERFSNGLLHPNDSAGSARQVINCRCPLNYIPKL